MIFDYVIVGAGTAGCVIASRLSETDAKVLLLEAGPPDRSPLIHIPAGAMRLFDNPRYNWNYATEGGPGTAGRGIVWPRGKTLGGSSSINGMLNIRGNPADFDGWAAMGCPGWSFDDILPFFKRAESYLQGGDPAYRGRDGPLNVEDYRTILPVTHHFVQAAQQAGHPLSPDLNGSQPEGVGYSQQNRRGRWRASGARTFLKAARHRPNLRVETDALATRLVFEGRRCVGVSYRQGGAEHTVRASREVVLCGGAVNSPQLMQVSGVGPAEHLQSIGVPVVHGLDGVGSNLQDHYVARIGHRVRGVRSINQLSRGPLLLREVARWVFTGRGALTFGITTAQVFCRSTPDCTAPDLQLLFNPGSFSQDPKAYGTLEHEPGVTVAVCPVKPSSRGTVRARSADATAAPAITPNYLSHPDDARVLLAGIHITRRIFASPAFAAYSVREIQPGAGIRSDDELLDYARRFGTTYMHPVSTCRMGSDSQAVVDPRLRVHGLGGLRVVDASVMPTLTTGNTNAATVMIAEKGAAMIRQDMLAS